MRRSPPPIAAAVLAYAAAIVIWSLPTPPDAVRRGDRPPKGLETAFLAADAARIHPVLANVLPPFGATQYWNMFAPDPASADLVLAIDRISRDGRTERSEIGRIADRAVMARMPAERARKLAERVSDPANDAGLRALCRLYDRPGIVEIRLSASVRPVSPPGSGLGGTPSERILYRYAGRG